MIRKLALILGVFFFFYYPISLLSQTIGEGFGVNTHNFPCEDEGNSPLKFYLEDLGVKWVRADLSWWHLEETREQHLINGLSEDEANEQKFMYIDEIVRYMQSKNLNILFTIGDTPEKFSPKAKNYMPEETVPEWKNFISEVVERYNGDRDRDWSGFNYNSDSKIYWAIWNEPNLRSFWNSGTWLQNTQLFLERVLIPGFQAVKETDPNAIICGPDLSANNSADWEGWIQNIHSCLINNGYQYDILTYHIYKSDADEVEESIAAFKEYVDDNISATIPIWITETGWTTNMPSCKRAEETYDLASWVRSHYFSKMKIFLYQYQYDKDLHYGLMTATKEPTETYNAFRYAIKWKPTPPINLGLLKLSQPYPETRMIWSKHNFCIEEYTSISVTDQANVKICRDPDNQAEIVFQKNNELCPIQYGWNYIILPPGSFIPGEAYELQVQMKDSLGRWGDWAKRRITYSDGQIDNVTPDDGVRINPGDNIKIEWTASNISSNFIIKLLKGSNAVGVINNNVDVNTQSINWNATDFNSGFGDDFKIRIETQDGTTWGESEGTFSIEEPANSGIHISSPALGDHWRIGNHYKVRFTRPEGMNSDMRILLHGPTSGIIKGQIKNDGVSMDWNWTINTLQDATPILPGNGYRIEIFSILSPAVRGTSDPFTIVDSIRITAPVLGQVLYRGQNFRVTFDPPPDCEDLCMKLYQNGQLYKSGIVYQIVANDGDKNWLVDKLKDGQIIESGSGYQIELISHQHPDVYGMSPLFSIAEYTPPSITITGPLAGSTITQGSTVPITWTSHEISGDVHIEYSTTGGSPWIHIGDTANDGVHSMTAPGSAFHLRISSINSPAVTDTEGPIQVQPPVEPSITITSPNGGENWIQGSTNAITWTAQSITGNLNIHLYRNGELLGLIASNLAPSSGSFSWTTGQYSGGNAATGSGYTIKIEESGAQVADFSNNSFSISATLTSQLVAFYPFNGNAMDESMNHNHGTLTGAVLNADRFGNADSAYRFTLNGHRIDCGNDSSLHISDNQISVSLWIKIDELNWSSVIGKTSSSQWDDGWGIYCTEATINFFINNWSTRMVNTNFTDTTSWHHVAGVYNGSEIRLYLDGMLKASRAYSANISDGGNLMINSIGGYMGGKRKLDDIRIYHRALSPDEITSLYNETPSINPAISVTSPNGGEYWQPGAVHNITWNTNTAMGNLSIQLYKDSQFQGIIVDNVNSELKTFPWTVGQYNGGSAAAGSGYSIKIKEMGTQVEDSSDNTFTISQLPSTQLIAHYPFTGNALDESINSNHGTVSGATLIPDRFGNAGSAYRFNLNGNRIDCGNHTSLRINDNQLSVSLWIKIDELNWSSVIGKTSSSQWDDGWGIYCTEATINFFINNWSTRMVNTNFTDTTSWHHVVGVYNGSEIRLYIDGVLKASRTYSANISDGGNLMINSIGGYMGGKRKLDDIRIYHRALSSQEIQSLYNE